MRLRSLVSPELPFASRPVYESPEPTLLMNVRVTLLLALALTLLGTRASAQPLLVLELTEEDHPAALRLLQLREENVLLARDPQPEHARELGLRAGASRVVVFDAAKQRVSVLQTATGALATRAVPAGTDSAYLAAFVAAELLALPAPAAPVAPNKPVAWEAPPAVRLTVRAGLQLLVAAPFPASPRADLGLGLERSFAGWALGGELFAAPVGNAEHATVLRRRSDAGLRLSAAIVRAQVSLAASLQLGAAWLRVRHDDPAAAAQHRVALAVGAGLELRYRLLSWLALYGAGVVTLTTPRGDYRVAGVGAVRESLPGATLGLGLCFTPPFR